MRRGPPRPGRTRSASQSVSRRPQVACRSEDRHLANLQSHTHSDRFRRGTEWYGVSESGGTKPGPCACISLGPVKRLLQDACVAKTNPKHFSPRRRFELSDEDIDTLGTVALAEKQLAAIVHPPPCPQSRGGFACPKLEGRDVPADLLLCFH